MASSSVSLATVASDCLNAARYLSLYRSSCRPHSCTSIRWVSFESSSLSKCRFAPAISLSHVDLMLDDLMALL